MASDSPNLDTSPNVKELFPRVGDQAASANIYGASSATPGLPKSAFFIEIIFTGSWPAVSGIRPVLESNFGGADKILQFTAESNTEVRFFAPGVVNGNVVYWDSQVSASVKQFANSGVTVTPRYPGI